MPLDKAGLLEVHEDHQSDKDLVDLSTQKILEHDDMIAVIKCLPVIKQTCIDCRPSIHKVVHSFYSCTSAHVGRAFLLVSKLVLVILKFFVKYHKYNPVKHLQQNGAQSYASVDVAILSGTSLVLDEQDDSTDEKTGINCTMER